MRGPANYMSLLVNRGTMTGFLVFDFADRYAEAAQEMAGWLQEGQLKSFEDVATGGVPKTSPRRSCACSEERISASSCWRCRSATNPRV